MPGSIESDWTDPHPYTTKAINQPLSINSPPCLASPYLACKQGAIICTGLAGHYGNVRLKTNRAFISKVSHTLFASLDHLFISNNKTIKGPPSRNLVSQTRNQQGWVRRWWWRWR